MHDLRVIAVETDVLLASADDGTRYRIPIDSETYSQLRRRTTPARDRKIAPRDIQAKIRAGMSAQDVADATGAPLDYIEKFEGPVLAERQFVVNAAQAVPVNTADETDPFNGSTFGTVMEERLTELGAEDLGWASWKDPESGWVVKLSFTAESVDHDARWQFDPKKSTLSPLNGDATRLSQQSETTGSLVPRLRAVPQDRTPDTTRFDSGAFTHEELTARDTAPYDETLPFSRGTHTVSPSAINSDDSPSTAESGNTADLLEALRRRRGQREAAPGADDSAPEGPRPAHPSTSGIRVIDVPLDDFADDMPQPPSSRGEESQPTLFTQAVQEPARHQTPQPKTQRRGRVSMPSWDDIVFGAKADDD